MTNLHGRNLLPSAEVLFRYRVVSAVAALELGGSRRSAAVRLVAKTVHVDEHGVPRHVSERTIYRWLAKYRDHQLVGLESARRQQLDGSMVLDDDLVKFLAEERERDRDASIPELLRRAEQYDIIPKAADVDRTTAWRVMRRTGVETRRRKQPQDADTRRFRYAERMQMTLGDFKHFRAGASRARRAAIYFLDDATRFGLGVRVCTSEQAEVVLLLLNKVIRQFGLMDLLFWDGGPGFKDHEVLYVATKLGIHPVHGRAGYPEGHGAIEAFNRSLKARTLRNLDGAPDIDPDCGALSLRLEYDLFEVYNHLPHEALDGDTPHLRWTQSRRALRPPVSEAWLNECFMVPLDRRVSADHVVSIGSTLYEVPRGHAGEWVTLYRRLLEQTPEKDALYIHHNDELVRIHPVDLAFNATSGRARRDHEPDNDVAPVPAKSASALAFDKTYGSMLDPDGGYPDHHVNEEE